MAGKRGMAGQRERGPNHELFYIFVTFFAMLILTLRVGGVFLAKLFFDNTPMAKSLNLLIIIGLQAIPSLYML